MEEKKDSIIAPEHYRKHKQECLSEMIQIFGPLAVYHFCLCNVWKYRYRAPFKGALEEDNKKSDWYLLQSLKIKRRYGLDDV